MERDEPDITPELVLRAYTAGVFPMAESADSPAIFWVDPLRRGVLPLDGLHVSRSLARRIRRGGLATTVNRDFARVIDACADRAETWINPTIRALYLRLHRMGVAHSIEVWDTADGGLRGGLYGVALGAAFFAESMVSPRTDGSKIALVALIGRLRAGGFRLCDTQYMTDHLERMGGIEIARADYRKRLADALVRPARFDALPADAGPQLLLQLSTQTS